MYPKKHHPASAPRLLLDPKPRKRYNTDDEQTKKKKKKQQQQPQKPEARSIGELRGFLSSLKKPTG